MKITSIQGYEIFDSRGWPALACEVILDNSFRVHTSVPCGLSKSTSEAHELRDGGKRFGGMGVLHAVEIIEEVIAPNLIGMEPDVFEADSRLIELDGTPLKSHLGANSILAVSMAVCRSQAIKEQLELYELIAQLMDAETVSLPFPLCNVINGGMHADNNLSIQEFLVIPIGATSFREGFEITVSVFHEVKLLLKRYGIHANIGDEGGWAPENLTDEKAIALLAEAIERVEENTNKRCVIGLDVAASHLYNSSSKTYTMAGKKLSTAEMISWYAHLMDHYPLQSIEDGLAEHDWNGWQSMTMALEDQVQIVGDDLFATSPERIAYGIEHAAATAAIIKPNQIGTITETLQAIGACQDANMNVIISHRSAETNDTFIADLAVGSNAGQIKAGGCSRGERLAKYNRLLAIESQLMGLTA